MQNGRTVAKLSTAHASWLFCQPPILATFQESVTAPLQVRGKRSTWHHHILALARPVLAAGFQVLPGILHVNKHI
jgi:hypothetical protein